MTSGWRTITGAYEKCVTARQEVTVAPPKANEVRLKARRTHEAGGSSGRSTPTRSATPTSTRPWDVA